MILHFVKIMGLLRFSKTYSGKSPSNTLRDTKFFGGAKNIKKKWGSVGPNLRNVRSSRKLRYEQIIIFKDDSIFSCIFEQFL